MIHIRKMLCLSMGVLVASGYVFAETVDNIQLESSSEQAGILKLEKKDEKSNAIILKGIEFSGNSIYTSQELESIIANRVGAEVTLQELQGLALAVQAKYHNDGYLIAKVIVPEQNFTSDKPVSISIFEGKLGKVNVIGNQNYKSKFITQSLSASEIVSDKAFTINALENTLARINRQAGITVASVLKQGDEQGYTNIDVNVIEQPRLTSVLDINNYGSENSGEYRAIAQLNLSNTTGRGDNLSFVGMHTLDGEGSHFANIAYNTPINSLGTKLGGYYSTGNVKVGKELAILDIQGDNQAWGIGVQHDYILDVNNFVQYEAWLESYDVNQEVLGIATAEDKIRKLKLGMNFEHLKDKSRSFYSLNLHQGFGEAMGGMKNNSALSTRAISNADNSFTKVSFDWMRMQRLTPRTYVIPRLYAQASFNPLVSGEQIAIGGYNSVVGHANAAYSGDSGFNLSLEGRYAILPSTNNYQLTAKLDYGQIYVDRSYLGESRSENLAGASIGFIAQPHKFISLKAEYARALSDSYGKDEFAYFQVKFTY